MSVTKNELKDLRSALLPMLTASSRLNNDEAAASRMIEAVHAGDGEAVGHAFTDMGVRGVSYRRGQIPVKANSPESFEFSPNDRWHIIITIEIDKP
jgi:hypothetical protein